MCALSIQPQVIDAGASQPRGANPSSVTAPPGIRGISAIGAAAVPGGRGSSSGSAGTVLNRFGPLYMGSQSKYTPAQAVALAQEFSLIAQQSGDFAPYVAAMKAANPALKIVAYMNGAFDQSAAGNAYPISWYALDANGKRIQSLNYGNWLMYPTSAWGSTIAARCTSLIASSNYDGCFLDTMGVGPLLPGYVTGVPINPATKAPYTTAEWIGAQSGTVAAVEAANPGGIVVTNGLASGPKYFSGTSQLLATSHTAMAEIWLRVAKNPVTSYPTVKAWKQDIDMLVNAESNGWSVMVTVKLWTTATAAQQAAWHKFALASFLLGTSGHCAMNFSTATTDAALSAVSPWDSAAVGMPSAAYYQSGGAYIRAFSNGLAIVNPGTSPVTITLGKTYVNLDGLTVSSETLAPDTGDVLVG